MKCPTCLKEIRTTLELKIYLILKQKQALKSLILCFARGRGRSSNQNYKYSTIIHLFLAYLCPY